MVAPIDVDLKAIIINGRKVRCRSSVINSRAAMS